MQSTASGAGFSFFSSIEEEKWKHYLVGIKISKTKSLCMTWTWLGGMNNRPLQSAPCNKNSSQIIPFCRKEKTPLALAWPEERSQEDIVRAYMVRITQWHGTHKRAGIYTKDTTRLIYTPTISATCALQHYRRCNKVHVVNLKLWLLRSYLWSRWSVICESFVEMWSRMEIYCICRGAEADLRGEKRWRTGTTTVYHQLRIMCKAAINTTWR